MGLCGLGKGVRETKKALLCFSKAHPDDGM
jgi:hypothetical protein